MNDIKVGACTDAPLGCSSHLGGVAFFYKTRVAAKGEATIRTIPFYIPPRRPKRNSGGGSDAEGWAHTKGKCACW